jgi:crotonobetainyl-CoA:carnitine CoA-transferase CaiB-like acyl-CoA transferase
MVETAWYLGGLEDYEPLNLRRWRTGWVPAASSDWLARFAAVGVPTGKVRTLDEVYTWDQTLSQGLLVDVDHPTLGTIQLPGPPLRMEGLGHPEAVLRSTPEADHVPTNAARADSSANAGPHPPRRSLATA